MKTYWIHKEHNENEILIKRNVYQIEPKHKEKWIKTYDAKEADELLKEKDDKIKEFGSEIIRLKGTNETNK